jgi:hypothetical protein
MVEQYTTHQSCLYEHPNEYTLHHDALFLQNPSPHNFFLSVHLPNKFYVWKLFFLSLLCYAYFCSCLFVFPFYVLAVNKVISRGVLSMFIFAYLKVCFSTLFILSILISGYLFNTIFIIIVAVLDFFHCSISAVDIKSLLFWHFLILFF